MSVRPRSLSATPPETYYGFRDDGSCFKSTEPVDNACARAMRSLVDLQRRDNLRPDEMVHAISQQPEFVQKMFRTTNLGQWSSFDSYWQWPLVWTSTSAEAALKHRAAGVPIDGQDHRSWESRRQLAERARGETSATPAEVSAPPLELLYPGWGEVE